MGKKYVPCDVLCMFVGVSLLFQGFKNVCSVL